MSPADDVSRPDPSDEDGTTDGTREPVHERWWWTGAFRAVLGAVVVGYQWQVVSTGEAGLLNWLMVALGGAVALWGAWIVWTAYRRQSST